MSLRRAILHPPHLPLPPITSPRLTSPHLSPRLTSQALGRYAYLIFVGLTFFFGWFTYNKVPETKGKTIAQVTKDFERY